MAEERLSIATFDPAHAQEPFLNSPRSIEACRLRGVNPIELVEVPLEEFRKDCPDDPDAAQRRFDKIDGARRRLMKEVKEEWVKLCNENWQPGGRRRASSSATRPAKECIIDVRPEAHTTLLDIQADRFRKMEMQEWKDLQRLVATEIRNAVLEAQNKAITEKHEGIKTSNDRMKRERQLAREQAYKERCEWQTKQAKDRELEQRAMQVKEAEANKKKKMETEIRLRNERLMREQRELERVQREEYTRNLKTRIYNTLEAKSEEQNRIWEARSKETTERIEAEKAARHAAMMGRRKEIEDRVAKALEDQHTMTEGKAQRTQSKLEADEARRRELSEERERQLKIANDAKNAAMEAKLKHIKDNMLKHADDKVERTKEMLAHKEQVAQQELERVAREMERRRRLKAIRQEAYDIAATRQRKADEHKKAQVEHDLKVKNDRCKAIVDGQNTLQFMKHLMKDVMGRARNAIRDGVAKLQSEDNFEPERVKELTESITNEVLLPLLQRTFGSVPVAKDGKLSTIKSPHELPALDHSRSGAFGGTAGSEEDMRRSRTAQGSGRVAAKSRMSASKSSPMQSPNNSTLGGTTNSMDLNATAGSTVSAEGGGVGGGEFSKLSGEGSVRPASTTVPPPKRKVVGKGQVGQGITLPLQPIDLDELGRTIEVSQERTWSAYNALHQDRTKSNSASPEGRRSRSQSPEKPARITAAQRRANERKRLESGGGDDQGGDSDDYDRRTRGRRRGGSEDDAGSDDEYFAPDRSAKSISSNKAKPTSPSANNGVKRPHNKNDKKAAVIFGVHESQSDLVTDDALPTHFDQSDFGEDGEGGDGDDEYGRRGRDNGSPSTSGAYRRSNSGGVDAHGSSRGSDKGKSRQRSLHHLQNPDANQAVADEDKKVFRREFSQDHPLAGGRGKYKAEKKGGLKPADATTTAKKKSGKKGGPGSGANDVVVFQSSKPHPNKSQMLQDPQRYLDNLRKDQNDALLKLLETERRQEDDRIAALRLLPSYDTEERNRLELVFAEERRRASERIINMTKTHEKRLKEAVIAVELGRQATNTLA